MGHDIQLRDIVDIGVLQEIQYKFSKLTGLASIIVDRDGQPITTPTKFSEYCNLIRSTVEGCKRCYESDGNAGCKASYTTKPHIYTCHAGLIDLAAPIVINNIRMGAILAGQLLTKRPSVRYTNLLKSKNSYLGMDVHSLIKALPEIQVISEEKVMSSAELLHIMANYVASIGGGSLIYQQLLSETRIRTELENSLESFEIKGLQSKISPHFLFNTLNIIIKQAILEDAHNTQETVKHLSNLLRYSLGKTGKGTVTLLDEISYIRDYLVLQVIRFGTRVSAVIEIPDDLMDIKMPPMTLQPLVENAIIHGLEPKLEGGCIVIRAWSLKNDHVIIEISDNGEGIEKDKLEEIIQKINLRYVCEEEIGITNVQRRLQIYFGSKYGISIDSVPGHGTTVQITVPHMKDGGTGGR